MNIKINSTLPYGYGISKVQPGSRAHMDTKKEREKQNEEKRANLLKQKAFIEELRRQQELQEKEDGKGKHFSRLV